MELDTKIIWFIAGFILILLEFAAPGLIVIFFGFGALIVSLGMWIGLIESVPAQCFTFAISSLLLLFALRRYMTSWFVGDSSKASADIEEEFVGKKAIVVKKIGGGSDAGKIEFKGAEWKARSETPIPVGVTAVITERDGLHLVVKPQEN